MECLNCNDPICDACREHALPGVGYKRFQREMLCGNCYADKSQFNPVRCQHCQGAKVKGLCACSNKRAECIGQPADEYSTEEV